MTIFSEVGKVADDVELAIARAIRSAMERDVNPGNSVNATANPLQVHIAGSYDLSKMAKGVRTELAAFFVAREDAARRFAKAVVAEAEKLVHGASVDVHAVEGDVGAEVQTVKADVEPVVQAVESAVPGGGV